MTYNIDDLIIDTISQIQYLIDTIAHFDTKEDLELRNFLYFLEGYFAFYDFPKAPTGGFGPPKLPETNPPCTTI